MNMDDTFKHQLKAHSMIIADIFKRNHSLVSNVIDGLNGTRDEMLVQFFSGLNVPVSQNSMVMLISILKSDE